MILLIVIGLPYTIVSFLPLFFLRKINKRLNAAIILNLQNYNERDLMDMHQSVSDTIRKINSVAHVTDTFFVFKPLRDEFLKIEIEDIKFEKALSDFLYPDKDLELSEEQIKELIEAYKPWADNSNSIILHG